MRHHAVHKAYLESLAGSENIARKEEFEGFGSAHDPWKKVCAAIARDKSHEDVGFCHPRLLCADTQVAHERHIEACSHGCSIDGRNDRLVKIFHGKDDPVYPVPEESFHVP